MWCDAKNMASLGIADTKSITMMDYQAIKRHQLSVYVSDKIHMPPKNSMEIVMSALDFKVHTDTYFKSRCYMIHVLEILGKIQLTILINSLFF